MSEENRTSDGLEQSLDSGIHTGPAAKGVYDAASNIGTAAASAAGAGTGAATGAGAAAGTTAGGPAGTVFGTVAGLLAGLLAKPVIKGVIVIAFFLVMVFSSLPSMFFEEPVDMADNTGPEMVYGQFKDYVREAYEKDIQHQKQKIEADFEARIASGKFSGYDHVTYTYTFDPVEEAFLAEVQEACVLIIAMFEIHTDDWRESSFAHFKRAVDSVNFWHDIVETEKLSETSTVTWSDGDEKEPESTIHVEMTYRFHDKGVEQFRNKFGLQDDREYLKSVEMSYNTRIYFGEFADLPMGGITGGVFRRADRRPRSHPARGTPVYAAMDGVVLLKLTNMRTFGHHIVIDHGGEITTMHAHLSSFGAFQEGEKVQRGQVIGYVGGTSTGLSTGPHLHFEYQINGSVHNPRLILPM